MPPIHKSHRIYYKLHICIFISLLLRVLPGNDRYRPYMDFFVGMVRGMLPIKLYNCADRELYVAEYTQTYAG